MNFYGSKFVVLVGISLRYQPSALWTLCIATISSSLRLKSRANTRAEYQCGLINRLNILTRASYKSH